MMADCDPAGNERRSYMGAFSGKCNGKRMRQYLVKDDRQKNHMPYTLTDVLLAAKRIVSMREQRKDDLRWSLDYAVPPMEPILTMKCFVVGGKIQTTHVIPKMSKVSMHVETVRRVQSSGRCEITEGQRGEVWGGEERTMDKQLNNYGRCGIPSQVKLKPHSIRQSGENGR